MKDKQIEWNVKYRLGSMGATEQEIIVKAPTSNEAIGGLRDVWFPDQKLIILSILPKTKKHNEGNR